jgi:hypothetical protein
VPLLERILVGGRWGRVGSAKKRWVVPPYMNPSMEIREVRLDEGHKGFSRDVIEGVLHIKGDVNMGGV